MENTYTIKFTEYMLDIDYEKNPQCLIENSDDSTARPVAEYEIIVNAENERDAEEKAVNFIIDENTAYEMGEEDCDQYIVKQGYVKLHQFCTCGRDWDFVKLYKNFEITEAKADLAPTLTNKERHERWLEHEPRLERKSLI